MAEREERLPVLDGLRGLAILLVLVHHGVYFLPVSRSEEIFARVLGGWNAWGWIGVDLFFVLSGYLITNILLQTRERPRYFRTFFARRTLRIFPLYYLSLVLLFHVLPRAGYDLTEVPEGERVWFWTYTLNIFYGVQNRMPLWMSHFWSLCVEEHFYLVWPFVVWLLGRRLKAVCIGIIVGVGVLRGGLCLAGVKPLALYCVTVTRMDALAMGGLIAALQQSPGGLTALRAICRWLAPALAAYLVLLGLATSGLHALSATVIVCGLSPVALFWGCCLVLLVTAAPTQLAARCLSRPTFTALGTYSYGLYVFHMPILGCVHAALTRPDELGDGLLPTVLGSQIPMVLVQSVLMIALSMLVAVASFHLYEKTFLSWKRYFIAPAVPRTAPLPLTAVQPLDYKPVAPEDRMDSAA